MPYKNIYQKLDFVQINYHLRTFSHQTVKLQPIVDDADPGTPQENAKAIY